MRKYSLVWIWFGLLAVIGVAAYGASSSIDFLESAKFIINGKTVKFPVVNYNGNVYVPLRLVGEEMHSAVHYDENKEIITIAQQSVKFDERVSAPVPSVAYEKKYKGTVWMQEIPLVQGSSCWNGCMEATGPVAQWVSQAEYPPVGVKPGSNLVIKYPAGLEPNMLNVYTVREISGKPEQLVEMKLDNDRLQLPEQVGTYTILINSNWNEGYTSYAFVVQITD